MMRIHTVAAGGGSICRFDGARFRVGPESAGANPGPASYRRGGPLTVTDCNVMVGKLDPELFPRVFGPAGDEPLDAAVVRAKFAALAAEVAAATGRARSPEEVADGFLEDRRRQHGECDQAHLGRARLRRHRVHAVLLRRRRRPARLPRRRRARHDARAAASAGRRAVGLRDGARRRARAEAAGASRRGCRTRRSRRPRRRSPRWRRRRATTSRRRGFPASASPSRRTLHVKYEGTDTTLETGVDAAAAVVAEFERKYRQQYGFLMPGKPLVVEAVAVEAIGSDARREATPCRSHAPRAQPARADQDEPDLHRRRVPRRGRLRSRCTCAPGDAIAGPAVIREDNATTVVEPGWRAHVHGARRPRARARRSGAARARDRHDGRPDPARGLQQPLHGDRRADGRDARQHRLLGQHQGAARLLVRAVRRRGQSHRQRAAHAGASGLDGREREDDHRAAPRHDAAPATSSC